MNADYEPGPAPPVANDPPLSTPHATSTDALTLSKPASSARRIAVWGLAAVFLMTFGIVTFGAGIFFERQVLAQEAESDDRVAVFNRAWDVVQENYVEEAAIVDELMLEGAIEGMLATLGDQGHTRYLTPEETALDRQSSRGIYYGVGIQVREDEEDGLVVTRIFPNSSAREEGVEPGDIIIAVDGEDVTNTPINTIIQLIRGPEGSRVDVTVYRPDSDNEITFDLERREIEVSAVTWTMLENNIALLRLEQFSDRSGDDLARALEAAQNEGAEGIVLDLRGNPGGLVREARQVASMFVPDEAPIYISRTRDGGEETHRAEHDDVHIAEGLPLVVLIDNSSASASEIVSGSIKSQSDGGTLVGETTVGTGTVLRQFELGDGSTIWLGVELWLTPDGQMIREEGISPDIVVPLAEDQTPFVPSEDDTPPPISELNDDQLEYALDLIAGSAALPPYQDARSNAELPW